MDRQGTKSLPSRFRASAKMGKQTHNYHIRFRTEFKKLSHAILSCLDQVLNYFQIKEA